MPSQIGISSFDEYDDSNDESHNECREENKALDNSTSVDAHSSMYVRGRELIYKNISVYDIINLHPGARVHMGVEEETAL